jgi:hypothetical protein
LVELAEYVEVSVDKEIIHTIPPANLPGSTVIPMSLPHETQITCDNVKISTPLELMEYLPFSLNTTLFVFPAQIV